MGSDSLTGEEGYGGSYEMLLDDLDGILSVHVFPSGGILAGAGLFQGKPLSLQLHLICLKIRFLRLLPLLLPRNRLFRWKWIHLKLVVTVGYIQGGHAQNVIPQTAKIRRFRRHKHRYTNAKRK